MPARPRVKGARRSQANAVLGRGVAMSFALSKLACSPPALPPPAPQPEATVTAAPAPTPVVIASAAPVVELPPPPDPVPALAPYRVTNTDYARRVLYTWTSTAQVEELLRTRVLLSRTESPTYGRSFYDRSIDERWLAGDKIAGLLHAPAFQKARFAWPAAWATVLGWPGESYGRELIEVTLKPSAWIALFRTSAKEWEVRDLQGEIVATAEVLKRPDRVAAVHFVHDAVILPPTTGTGVRPPIAGDGRAAYREYVLCNESMIESWAVATERVAAEIDDGASAVEAAAKYFEARPPPAQRDDRWNAHVALLVWAGLAPATAAKEAYEAALAFPNPNYVTDPAVLRKLAAELRKMPQHGPATTHRPTMLFPGAKPVAIPPPPPPPPVSNRKFRGGTFY